MTHNLPLIWSKRALSDLDKIADFIAADQPVAANLLVQAIKAKTQLLRNTPFLGREVLPGVRELIVHRHYLLVYRIKNDRIEILQVWHTARKR